MKETEKKEMSCPGCGEHITEETLRRLKDPESVEYDRFEIFFKDKMHILSLDPRMYTRRHVNLLGKLLLEVIHKLKV